MTTDTYNLIISGNIHEAGVTIVMIVKTDVGYGPTIQFSDDNVGVLRILCAYLVLGVHFATSSVFCYPTCMISIESTALCLTRTLHTIIFKFISVTTCTSTVSSVV
jgi:hypothetical protein